MNFIAPLFYFLFATGTFVIISKKKFGISLPIVMMLSAFCLFFSQLIFKTFYVGLILNLIFAIMFPILLIVIWIKRKTLFREIKEKYFSTGFFVFLIIFVLFYVFNLNRSFSDWDEFSHWGVMVKEMLRLDRFYTVDASTLMVHKDYPPIIQLFELFWCKLSGGYSESNLITALHILSFSFFVPIISEIKINKEKIIKSITKIILMILIFYLLILSFDMHGIINSIYTDYVMAIVFVYGIYLIISNKDTLNNFVLLNLSITISFLLLTKQMSLAFFLLIIFLFIIDLLLKNNINVKFKEFLSKIKIKKMFTKKNILVFLKCFVLLIVIPLVIWKIWGIYTESLNATAQFSLSDIKVFELPSIILGNGGFDYQRATFIAFKSSLINYNVGASLIRVNYILWMLISVCIAIFLSKKYKDYFYKNQIYGIGSMIFVGFIGYAATMLILYMFSFGEVEGPALASYDRYMSTFVLAIMLIFFIIYLLKSKIKNSKNFLRDLLIILVVLLLIQIPSRIKILIPAISHRPQNQYEIYAEKVIKNTEDDSKVFVVADGATSEYSYFIKYYSNPRFFNLKYFNLPYKENSSIKDYNAAINEIKKYDYLYLIKIDDSFVDEYGYLFTDNNISEGQLYKISIINNKLKFTFIE